MIVALKSVNSLYTEVQIERHSRRTSLAVSFFIAGIHILFGENTVVYVKVDTIELHKFRSHVVVNAF